LQADSGIRFASTNSKKQLKLLAKQDHDFVYLKKKGQLFFNGNGADKGWGDTDEGGLVAILKGKPGLSVNDLMILV